jgi:hypothetical protein
MERNRRQIMEWISVKDKLPEVDEQVLVYAHGVSYNSGAYSTISIECLTNWEAWNEIGVSWSCYLTCNEEVTHWMPLPTIPLMSLKDIDGTLAGHAHFVP